MILRLFRAIYYIEVDVVGHGGARPAEFSQHPTAGGRGERGRVPLREFTRATRGQGSQVCITDFFNEKASLKT